VSRGVARDHFRRRNEHFKITPSRLCVDQQTAKCKFDALDAVLLRQLLAVAANGCSAQAQKPTLPSRQCRGLAARRRRLHKDELESQKKSVRSASVGRHQIWLRRRSASGARWRAQLPASTFPQFRHALFICKR